MIGQTLYPSCLARMALLTKSESAVTADKMTFDLPVAFTASNTLASLKAHSPALSYQICDAFVRFD